MRRLCATGAARTEWEADLATKDAPGMVVKKGAIKAKGTRKPMPKSPGRPRLQLDIALLLELRAEGYGFKKAARLYVERTGDYVSANTIRERLRTRAMAPSSKSPPACDY